MPLSSNRIILDPTPHQAARASLAPMRTPITAVGGAEGERCTGCPAAIAAATISAVFQFCNALT